MIIPDLDDLILESDGEYGVEELGRRTLSEGSWTSVAYLVRTRRGDEPWKGPLLWLHRYQKVAQGWKLAAKFHTTEPGQLEMLLEALRAWKLFES
jgi:hypothetical protein